MAVLVLALVWLKPGLAWAQRENATGSKHILVKNLPEYDVRSFHPGFYLAANLSRYVPEYSAASARSSIRYLTRMKPGFTVGFIGDLQVHDYLRFRFVPGVGFYTREVIRRGGPDVINLRDTTQQIGSTTLELPLLLKYVSKRRKNVRMYLIGGVKPSFDVGNKKKDRLPGQLRSTDSDLSIEYGVGVDLFYPIFKFAPEIRISHGLWNRNTGEDTQFNNALGRYRSHTVTLFLNFE